MLLEMCRVGIWLRCGAKPPQEPIGNSRNASIRDRNAGGSSNRAEGMRFEEQNLGSWQGLSLVRRVGSSEIGAHRHSSHLLSLQLEGAVQTDWRDGYCSNSTRIAPSLLTLLPAGSHHVKCTVRANDASQEPVQLVASINPAILEAAVRERVKLEEGRTFRDIQLERMLWFFMTLR